MLDDDGIDRLIAFTDVETLGLHADHHAVWEVSTIVYDPETRIVRDQATWQIQLTEAQIEAGDPTGMAIGGFHDRYDPLVAVPARVVCMEFAAMVDNAHLCGNVISFDEERLRRLCLANGVAPSWHYHLIDVESMAIGYFHGYAAGEVGHPAPDGLPPVARSLPWKSEELSLALGVDPASFDRHTSLGDCRWAIAEYEAIHRG